MGTGCPNRDGTIGRGGCAYCNNQAFSPAYISHRASIQEILDSLENGKAFFSRKYPEMKYLAYFQSYTNTYGRNIHELMEVYEAVSEAEDIVGIVIGTRPDCVSDKLLDSLGVMNDTKCPVLLEFGAESSHNETLEHVNRCHTWETTIDTVLRAHARGLSVGLHFILGLPGENETMMLETVRRAVALPIDTLKFHQLQIVKGTRFAREYEENAANFQLFTPEAYVDLCRKIIRIVVPTKIAIERFVSQSPDDMLIAPRWGLKNYQFVNLLNKSLTIP